MNVFLLVIIAALTGLAIGPAVDSVVTTYVADRWEVSAIGLDTEMYYILAYRELPDGGLELAFWVMPKDGACLRAAVGEWPYFEDIAVFKFGIQVGTITCLYL